MTGSSRWRASQFQNGYSAEFLPSGERTWRIVKSGGEPIVFVSRSAAIGAAENAYWRRAEPTIRSTKPPPDADKIEAKMKAEAESWLRTTREDRRKAETIYSPGKRPLLAVPGRAR